MTKLVKDNCIDVLDKGYLRLVDHMGSDLSVVRSARVSYDGDWRAGDDKGSDDRLINYLYSNGHSTPFESCTLTFQVKAPILVLRQWMRHRTQCLVGDTKLCFIRPCDDKPYHVKISDIVRRWNENSPVQRKDKQNRSMKDFNRDRIGSMRLRCIDENGDLDETTVVDAWECGIKPVYKMTLSNKKSITASKDHKFQTTEGWKRLGELTLNDSILCVGAKAKANKKEFVEFSAGEIAEEVWKDTKYSNTFVSNLGRISRDGKVRKQTLNPSGRLVVSLKFDGKWKAVQVSGIVAECFLENKPGKNQVLHIDDCAENNRVENLKYGDDKDNKSDAINNGRMQGRRVVNCDVVSIEFIGDEMTYDIEVAHDEHNFIANTICTHNSFNELSARYTKVSDDFYVPEPEHIGVQSSDNKQMREFSINNEASELDFMTVMEMREHNESTYKLYLSFIERGVPRELARSVLPVSTYSTMFTTMNLHNCFRFLSERLHEHSQYEIRVYAQAILKIIEPLYPVSVAAFKRKHDIK